MTSSFSSLSIAAIVGVLSWPAPWMVDGAVASNSIRDSNGGSATLASWLEGTNGNDGTGLGGTLPWMAQSTDATAAKIEADRLQQQGLERYQTGDFGAAIQLWQQALERYRALGDRKAEALTLYSLGSVRDRINQPMQSLSLYQQALILFRQIDDPTSEGATLNRLGAASYQLGDYTKSLDYLQQALAVNQTIQATAETIATFNSLGRVYDALGRREDAIAAYQNVLTLDLKRRDAAEEDKIAALRPQREELHQIADRDAVNDESTQYQEQGNRDRAQGNYAAALNQYRQALKIRQDNRDRPGEIRTLNQIGGTYHLMQDYANALNVYRQGLDIARSQGHQPLEGQLLQNMGISAARAQKAAQAIDLFQEAAVVYKALGYRALEGETLDNIGYLLARQNQPELAIVFYKQAIDVLESVRRDLRILPPEKQTVFPQAFASTYRALADLLLSQDRILEAQAVLDLLKVQELDDYLRNVRGNAQTQQGIISHPQETQLWQQHSQIRDRAVQLGKELAQLRQIPTAQRTPQQTKRISEIDRILQQLRQDFNQFIQRPDVVALVQQLNQTASGQNLDLPNLNRLQRQLRRLEQSTVLLYPLILDDRLEIVVVTPYTPPIRRTVAVSRQDFNQEILRFRSALRSGGRPVRASISSAQNLYRWLIEPIEADLAQTNAQTILYAPDGPLRYIPLAALHDGNRWLVERFRINHITASTLTDLNTNPLTDLAVLAAAFTQGSYEFQVGTRQFIFAGLQFAAPEVENIAAKIPATIKLLDNDFNRNAIVPHLNDHNVVHFATHAAFVGGTPEDSFILLGDGDRITLREVENWNLTGVDLIVLSACQTAVGGQLGDGREILGLGHQMQQAGALATIASLWIVDDEGTHQLMDAFYERLTTGTPKAEALRQAQLALIRSDRHHPYYWAPFILIGNGL